MSPRALPALPRPNLLEQRFDPAQDKITSYQDYREGKALKGEPPEKIETGWFTLAVGLSNPRNEERRHDPDVWGRPLTFREHWKVYARQAVEPVSVEKLNSRWMGLHKEVVPSRTSGSGDARVSSAAQSRAFVGRTAREMGPHAMEMANQGAFLTSQVTALTVGEAM